MKNTKRKGFTLVEILIVLVICGILFGVLFRTYGKITDIAFKTEREKNMNQELVYVSQVFQNISDEYTIDIDKYYNNKDKKNKTLIQTKWLTETLYFTGRNINTKYESIAFSSTGNCLEQPLWIAYQKKDWKEDTSWCWLNMQVKEREDGSTIQNIALTNTGKVLFTTIKFKIIPYNTPEKYYEAESSNSSPNKCKYAVWKESVAKCIASKGFWLITTAYAPLYREDKRVNNVKMPLQLFFNN